MNIKYKTTWVMTGMIGVCATLCGAEHADISKLDLSKLPPAAKKQGVTYATDISPIFKDSCVRCHGSNRPKAGLQLDSLDGVLKGSKEGKVVVPGDSKKSLLVIAVAQLDPKLTMPPKRRPGGKGGGGPGHEEGPGKAPAPDGKSTGGDHPPGGPGFGPPPKPLTPEQVGLVRAWVDQGAK